MFREWFSERVTDEAVTQGGNVVSDTFFNVMETQVSIGLMLVIVAAAFVGSRLRKKPAA